MTATDEVRARLESGLAMVRENRLDEAEAEYRRVLAVRPDNPDAHNLLGLLTRQRGDLATAMQLVERAIELDAARPGYRMNLAGMQMASGNYAAAAETYAEAARLQPGEVTAPFNRGIALARLQRHAEAARVYIEILKGRPDFAPAWSALAAAHASLGRHDDAEAAAHRAIELEPDQPEAWLNLARALTDQGRLGDAESALRRALELAPRFAQAAFNLGCVLQCQWRIAESLDAFRIATECDPRSDQAWCNRLMTALYDPAQTEESIYKLSLLRIEAASRPALADTQSPPFGASPDRALRVGYVSPDFVDHSCAFFLKPLFVGHDASRVEIFAYANTTVADDVTQWFRENVDQWRDISRLSDSQVAELVRSDQIDVLVDVAGHSANNRIGVFVLKPAPVQVSWLGYPATTGLQQIRYRLTDSIADPEGAADSYHVEKLLRLDGGFLCYSPRDDAPEVHSLPAERAGHITFGSCNNILKITPDVVAAWARILDSVEGSRLALKGWLLNYPETSARVEAAFAAHAIDASRLTLHGWMPDGEFLDLYHEIDIALDTFPYNGTTTTFEALWMGAPVVALRGERHAGRVGASILTHLGRSEWLAEDVDGYVAVARDLAADIPALAALRAGIRGELQRSRLCDAPGFARKIERTFEMIGR